MVVTVSNGSYSSSNRGGNTTNEQYSSGVHGVPLEVYQEEMRMRAASRSSAGSSNSALLSILSLSEEEEILY